MKRLFIFLGVILLVCGCGKYTDKDLILKDEISRKLEERNGKEK